MLIGAEDFQPEVGNEWPKCEADSEGRTDESHPFGTLLRSGRVGDHRRFVHAVGGGVSPVMGDVPDGVCPVSPTIVPTLVIGSGTTWV